MLSVAKLQNDAQTHTVYNYTNQGTPEQTASGPHDLCMGSVETVPVANAPAHIMLVGETSNAGGQSGGVDQRPVHEGRLNEQGELDKPYVIPVASKYDQASAEFQD